MEYYEDRITRDITRRQIDELIDKRAEPFAKKYNMTLDEFKGKGQIIVTCFNKDLLEYIAHYNDEMLYRHKIIKED